MKNETFTVDLRSVFNKAANNIRNPSILQQAEQREAMDIENFAITTLKVKDLHKSATSSSIKDSILGVIDNVKAPVLTGGAGALLAGGLTALTSQKREDETKEEYRKRVAQDAVINALAGGAVGGSIPFALSELSKLKGKETPLSKKVVRAGFRYGALPAGVAVGTSLMDKVRHRMRVAGMTKNDGPGSRILGAELPRSERILKPLFGENSAFGNMKGLFNTVVAGNKGLSDGALKLRAERLAILKSKLRNPLIAAGLTIAAPYVVNKGINSMVE